MKGINAQKRGLLVDLLYQLLGPYLFWFVQIVQIGVGLVREEEGQLASMQQTKDRLLSSYTQSDASSKDI